VRRDGSSKKGVRGHTRDALANARIASEAGGVVRNVVPHPTPPPSLVRRLAMLIALLSCIRPACAEAPSVTDLVNQFDPIKYQNIVSNGLYTRQGMNRTAGIGPQNPLCREFIHQELLSYGLSATQDVFAFVDTSGVPRTAGNVIAVKEGVQNPENEIYVIGSHFDSEENPGADDNATGVGAQLEMARIFNQYHFAKTVVFCAFDAEEIYDFNNVNRRLGSTRYVNQHSNDNIKGMVSVDMIGWQTSGSASNQAWIYGRPGIMDPIRNDVAAAITEYGDGMVPVLRTGNGDYSDHVAFANAGFQACLFIEGSFSSNPNYHQLGDYVEQPNYIDWTYAGRMSRIAIGYFATKLQPVDVTPSVVSIQPETNSAVLIRFLGLPGCKYATELTTNLDTPVWNAFQTNTAAFSDGAFAVVDTQAGARPQAFYRARFVSGYNGATNSPPIITSQPQDLTVEEGDNAIFTASASGPAPRTYQWQFAGADIVGATNTSYTRYNAQTQHAGDYRLVANNAFGAVTSQVAVLAVSPSGYQAVFADDFDTDTSASWMTNRSSTDTRVTFQYDYSADDIPSAPHSANGTTRGVKFEANMVTPGATAALCISPLGQAFAGDYRLRFDMWINANGPFPGGGTGSTEHFTAGIGTDGSRVQWTGTGSTADGHWFVVDGEGGSTDTTTASVPDFGALSGTSFFTAGSGIYAAGTGSNSRGNGNSYYTGQFPGQSAPATQLADHPQQTGSTAAGTVGFAWRDVIVNKTGNSVEWFIDGLKIATVTNATFTASNIFVGYWDSYTSVSDNTALSFGLVDNVRVQVPAN